MDFSIGGFWFRLPVFCEDGSLNLMAHCKALCGREMPWTALMGLAPLRRWNFRSRRCLEMVKNGGGGGGALKRSFFWLGFFRGTLLEISVYVWFLQKLFGFMLSGHESLYAFKSILGQLYIDMNIWHLYYASYVCFLFLSSFIQYKMHGVIAQHVRII